VIGDGLKHVLRPAFKEPEAEKKEIDNDKEMLIKFNQDELVVLTANSLGINLEQK
jgi:hypothetical protein